MSSMSPKIKTRKALSAILTTLIIMVASVVLATGIILYGTSLFQTNSQSSGLAVQGSHVWVNATTGMSTTYSWGAAEIRNSGDKILSVDQILVRGTQVPFANWYYDSNPTRVTVANFQSQLNYTGTRTSGGANAGLMNSFGAIQNCPATSLTSFYINEYTSGPNPTNPTLCFAQASGPISLKPGDKTIVYFQIPNNILSTIDQGSKITLSIFAGDVGSPQTIAIQSQT